MSRLPSSSTREGRSQLGAIWLLLVLFLSVVPAALIWQAAPTPVSAAEANEGCDGPVCFLNAFVPLGSSLANLAARVGAIAAGAIGLAFSTAVVVALWTRDRQDEADSYRSWTESSHPFEVR